MIIDKVIVKGFRNFRSASISLARSTLIIGANNSGKTNLIYALRILLDKTLSDSEIEPDESDFHIPQNGEASTKLSITVYFSDIQEDAVLSSLKGHISDNAKCVLRYTAYREDLSYTLELGEDVKSLQEIQSRYYLKYINLRYVKSQRDLEKYINSEKRQLLKLSSENRDEEEVGDDQKQMERIGRSLEVLNERVRRLNYVKGATDSINEELQKLAHDFSGYSVQLDSGAIQVQQFIDNLKLGASTSGSKVMLGGDGRNNQILMALWKAKSQREHDPDSEVVFYCVEEPEAHLHPHQQRKLADYLINDLPGQTFITTHSPQVTARYKPDSILHIKSEGGESRAASGGCGPCISVAWDELGYRMSILPAEAFFAKSVLLVEGPSELLFYSELAKHLNIDLDYYNISLLAVDGIQFKVYIKILDAMEIPWTMRTDNDVSHITKNSIKKKNLAGINRCLRAAKLAPMTHAPIDTTIQSLLDDGTWDKVSTSVNPAGIFLSRKDLEHDLAEELPIEIVKHARVKAKKPTMSASDAIAYLQSKKAVRMRQFLKDYSESLGTLRKGNLAKPLLHCVKAVEG